MIMVSFVARTFSKILFNLTVQYTNCQDSNPQKESPGVCSLSQKYKITNDANLVVSV